MFTRAIEPAGVPLSWSGSAPAQLSVKTPLLYDDGVNPLNSDEGNGPQEYDGLLARTWVTGGLRSGTLVLASIALTALLSRLPAASWAMLWKA